MQINEIFNSVEGEGINSGLPTTFIRLQGCLQHCLYCDSKFTWSLELGDKLSIDEIVSKVISMTQYGNLVSITGGDPMLQFEELKLLTKQLINKGFLVNLEHTGLFTTNIRKEIEFLHSLNFVSFDIKTPCSNINIDKVLEGITFVMEYRYTFSIKCVIQSPDDIEFLEKYVFPYKDPRTVLTLMPCNSKNTYEETPLVVKDIVNFLSKTNYKNIRLGCQLHKVFNLE